MPLIALETSGALCSVAVGDAGRVTTALTEEVGRGHAARLVPMIGEALAAADVAPRDLDGVVVGIGPGSFTGVRVALSAALGLCLAAGCGLAPVDGFETLRRSVRRDAGGRDAVLVSLDSLRDDLFATLFAADDRVVLPATAGSPGDVADLVAAALGPGAAVTVTGNAAGNVLQALADRGLQPCVAPSGPAIEAAWMLLGDTDETAPALVFGDPALARPLYLRAPSVADPSTGSRR